MQWFEDYANDFYDHSYSTRTASIKDTKKMKIQENLFFIGVEERFIFTAIKCFPASITVSNEACKPEIEKYLKWT